MIVFSVICFIVLWSRISSASRFALQWDAHLEPRLVGGLMYLEVDVDDFLDIICPFKSGHSSRSNNKRLNIELYNVTKEEFRHCNASDESKILRCVHPSKETKLTTKFQKRSPSPLGFVFRPGQTYYYFSKPTMKLKSGCDEDNLKLVITIRKEHTDHHHHHRHHKDFNKQTTWKKTKGDTSMQSTDSIDNTHSNAKGGNNIHKSHGAVRPVVKSPQASLASGVSSDKGDNAAMRTNLSWIVLIASNFLASLLI